MSMNGVLKITKMLDNFVLIKKLKLETPNLL